MPNPPPPPPKGNKRGTKLKEPNIRQEAYRQYCDHIASGLPKEAFFFDHPKHSVSWETMDRYIVENPGEFQPLLMQRAKADRYKKWFTTGTALVQGKIKNGSPVTWSNIMRNMFGRDYGWDKEEVAETNRSHIQRLADAVRQSTAIPETENCDSDEQCQS